MPHHVITSNMSGLPRGGQMRGVPADWVPQLPHDGRHGQTVCAIRSCRQVWVWEIKEDVKRVLSVFQFSRCWLFICEVFKEEQIFMGPKQYLESTELYWQFPNLINNATWKWRWIKVYKWRPWTKLDHNTTSVASAANCWCKYWKWKSVLIYVNMSMICVFLILYSSTPDSVRSYSCYIYSSLVIPSLLSEQKSFVKMLKVKYIKR